MIRIKKMARSRGFEPLTAWFVARYSIQLSYERVKGVNTNDLDTNCNPKLVLLVITRIAGDHHCLAVRFPVGTWGDF